MTDGVPLGDYMTATEQPRLPRRVTSSFVITDRHGGTLGAVEWYGAWRGYCFFPEGRPVFNPDCLQRLAAFTALCTREHKMAARDALSTMDRP